MIWAAVDWWVGLTASMDSGFGNGDSREQWACDMHKVLRYVVGHERSQCYDYGSSRFSNTILLHPYCLECPLSTR
jgi:hypothetical protein